MNAEQSLTKLREQTSTFGEVLTDARGNEWLCVRRNDRSSGELVVKRRFVPVGQKSVVYRSAAWLIRSRLFEDLR